MSNSLFKRLLLLWSLVAAQCVAWHSEDKPFAVGYPSGKILLATTETYENEQPVMLSVFQVCLQNALHTHFNCMWWRAQPKITHFPPKSVHKSVTWNSFSIDFLFLQDSVSSLKWDPTGHLLLCLGRSEVVKILGRSGATWVTLHSLIHTSMVNIAEWCPLAGRAPDPRLMMAVWVHRTDSSFSLLWIFSILPFAITLEQKA